MRGNAVDEAENDKTRLTIGLPPPGALQCAPHQIIYIRQATPILQHYPTRCSKGLGVIQILCGVTCIILGVCVLGLDYLRIYSPTHEEIWGVVCAITAGGFGIASAKSKTTGMIVANLILSIFAVFYNVAGCIVNSILLRHIIYLNSKELAHNDLSNSGMSVNDLLDSSSDDHNYQDPYYSSVVAVGALIIFITALEAICALWAAAIACRFVCCRCCERCCCPCYNKKNTEPNAEAQALQVRYPIMAEYRDQSGVTLYSDAVGYPTQPPAYQTN